MFIDFSSYYGAEVEEFGIIKDSESFCRFLLDKAQVCSVYKIGKVSELSNRRMSYEIIVVCIGRLRLYRVVHLEMITASECPMLHP